jgi:hypothetical protein
MLVGWGEKLMEYEVETGIDSREESFGGDRTN